MTLLHLISLLTAIKFVKKMT